MKHHSYRRRKTRRTRHRRRGGDSGATGYVQQILGSPETQYQQSLYSQPWNNLISAQSNQSVPQPGSGLNPNISTSPIAVGPVLKGGRHRRHRRHRTHRKRRH
jgi:hypothetical protein